MIKGQQRTATVKVRVFHNNERQAARWLGYSVGHSVTEVLAVEWPIGAGAVGAEVARATYELLDGREVTVEETWVVAYFERGNRPLRHGDVIAVVEADSTTFYAIGDEVTAIDAPRVVETQCSGTAWIDDQIAVW